MLSLIQPAHRRRLRLHILDTWHELRKHRRDTDSLTSALS